MKHVVFAIAISILMLVVINPAAFMSSNTRADACGSLAYNIAANIVASFVYDFVTKRRPPNPPGSPPSTSPQTHAAPA